MEINETIIKYYLKNVMFITGTAYAGKSTMVKMLAENYGLICCGENYNCIPCIAKVNSKAHYDEFVNSGFFTIVREDTVTDTKSQTLEILAKHFGLID